MNTHIWTQYFINNRNRFTEPDMPLNSPGLRESVKLPLVRSLAIFQLGESGGGTRLLRYVRRVVTAEQLAGYEHAVGLFIEEEQYHARLLARLVNYLGGECMTKQWTNSIFRWLRNHFGVEFNIQVLLIAELIAEAYFKRQTKGRHHEDFQQIQHRPTGGALARKRQAIRIQQNFAPEEFPQARRLGI